MAFPTSPVDGQIHNEYKYNTTLGVWKKFGVDELFPIGMLYTQYPGKNSPIDLGWPGTWTNKSSEFAGDFFRAEGGNAAAFEAGEQSDLTRSHNHSMWVYNASAGSWSTDEQFSAGYFTTKGTWGSRASWVASSSGGDETRPVNKTIRIWERTA